jgi:hypothetical protein
MSAQSALPACVKSGKAIALNTPSNSTSAANVRALRIFGSLTEGDKQNVGIWFSKKPVAKDSKGDFVKALDAAVSAARNSGVDIRFIYSKLESRAEGLRAAFVMTAPLHASTEW